MPDTAKPNLLLIMTDQQRFDALGIAGDWVDTPHLDRLAAEGVHFRSCVTTSPVCVPARASLLTGRYCHNHGIWDNPDGFPAPNAPTWIQAIRNAGYETALIGKTHWHPHQGDIRDNEHLLNHWGYDIVHETVGPRATCRVRCEMTEQWEAKGLWEAHQEDYRQRFDHKPWVVRPSALPLEDYYDTWVGQRCVSYLRDAPADQPWFCHVSFGGPHEPWDTPEPWASRYKPEAMPPARDYPASVTDDRPHGRLDDVPPVSRPEGLTDEDIAAMRADYAGNVALIDDQVGQMLDTLEARGDLDRTAIVFTSDHGELNGDAGMIYKNYFLDGAVRVPLIVRTPATATGPAAGQANDSPVEWIDVGPTLVDLAGGTIQHRQFGQSLAPTLQDPTARHRDDA
ncbi:MAG: sulfatase-like hydrolase/transferase, partial [Phycisphaeraceae bacterium]|nr:sulfatase-like hydrolase/transferase [Phycisphaeraceae bacterium]